MPAIPDVVVVGGGPAGSAVGCFLARAGIDTLILERAHHPRTHVGESLVPSTTRIFDELGFLPKMEKAGFVRKYGAGWHPPGRRGAFTIRFKEVPQPGVRQDYTYHVDRSRFDHLLLEHAAELGCRVRQGAAVRRVAFEKGRATGVVADLAGDTVHIPCRMVVDASGRTALLGRQLRLKTRDPVFDQYAVHAWFRGVDRGVGETADYIHIYFLAVERGWVWQIPIREDVTSVGVVAEKRVFKESRLDVGGWFEELVASHPDAARAMRDAERINAFKSEADYSYSLDRYVGDGFAVVGDAARFVDPIFSSGVSVALYGAKFASEQIREALAAGDVSAARLSPYEEKLRAGVGIWYEFIRLYYRLMPAFTYFITSPRYRRDTLRLLQGEVYDRREAPVLDRMRRFIETVERTDAHLLRSRLEPATGK